MIFPFEKRIFSIESLPKRFVLTLIADMERDGLSGYVVFLGEATMLTLVFDGGRLSGACRWRFAQGVERFFETDIPLLEMLEAQVGVEVFQANEDAVMMAMLFTRANPAWRLAGRGAFSEALEQASKMGACLVAKINEGFADFGLMDKREIKAAYAFNSETRSYARSPVAYMDSGNDEEESLAEILLPDKLVHPTPHIAERTDIIIQKVSEIAALLDTMTTLILPIVGEDAYEMIDTLAKGLSAKYQNLFDGIRFNEQTKTVNWRQVMNNRLKVDVSFRYERFPEVLNELLTGYAIALYEKKGAGAIEKLRDEMAKSVKISDDPADPVKLLMKMMNQLRK